MGLDSREQTLAKVSKAGASIKKNGDAKDVSSRVNSVVSFYYELGDFTAALIVADKMPTPRAQAHLRYEICRRGAECGKMKWDECLAHLKEYMDTKPEAHEMMNAKYTMAGILRDRMGDAKKALAIYTEINDPPRSLWELVTTYRRLGEKRKAENILQEIASIFERDAPRAILTLAQFCEADGDKKKAIALYRRLLSQPEWKKTGESSQAHQALERLGERTGGAMINEVR
jgi:tetratricopeptide (TPR) repeat protein